MENIFLEGWSTCEDCCRRRFESQQGNDIVSMSKRRYTHCLVLVGSRMDSSEINISCKSLFRNRAKINMFKPNKTNQYMITIIFTQSKNPIYQLSKMQTYMRNGLYLYYTVIRRRKTEGFN